MKSPILFIGAMLVACGLNAGTLLKGDPTYCSALARNLDSYVELRDMGMTWKDVEEMAKEILKEVMGDPRTIVEDQADADYILKVLQQVWDKESDLGKASSTDLLVKVTNNCMLAKKAKMV